MRICTVKMQYLTKLTIKYFKNTKYFENIAAYYVLYESPLLLKLYLILLKVAYYDSSISSIIWKLNCDIYCNGSYLIIMYQQTFNHRPSTCVTISIKQYWNINSYNITNVSKKIFSYQIVSLEHLWSHYSWGCKWADSTWGSPPCRIQTIPCSGLWSSWT